MSETQLRQVWAGLMPSFPDPATLLDISDPDDRAATMLLKTLYVLFKGEKDDVMGMFGVEDRWSLRWLVSGSLDVSEQCNGSSMPLDIPVSH